MMSTREKHPKIHRIALVDNDPRALDSLSAVIASKVPTAYVVWTATSGCEAIERCQDANGHVSLLISICRWRDCKAPPRVVGCV